MEIYMVFYCLLREKLFVKRESCFDFDVSIKSEGRVLDFFFGGKRLNKKKYVKYIDLFIFYVILLYM